MWGLRFGARAALLSTEHTFMVLAFERSTYVYQFSPGQGPRVVSDTRACEWRTDAETLYACTMFDGDGIVQVCRPPPSRYSPAAGCPATRSIDGLDKFRCSPGRSLNKSDFWGLFYTYVHPKNYDTVYIVHERARTAKCDCMRRSGDAGLCNFCHDSRGSGEGGGVEAQAG